MNLTEVKKDKTCLHSPCDDSCRYCCRPNLFSILFYKIIWIFLKTQLAKSTKHLVTLASIKLASPPLQ